MLVDDPNPGETPPNTILVIEPDILVRMTIADYLRSCGYRVYEGATADDVVTVLGTEHKIDVIFAEVQLSGSMDGFGLAQWVREKHPGVDVVLTSGIAKAAKQAAAKVAAYFKTRPFGANSLSSAAQNLTASGLGLAEHGANLAMTIFEDIMEKKYGSLLGRETFEQHQQRHRDIGRQVKISVGRCWIDNRKWFREPATGISLARGFAPSSDRRTIGS